MKRGKTGAWYPLFIDKWLLGSTRLELILESESGEFLDLRGIWLDLMTLAHKDEGWIRANETTPYPLRMLAGMLCVPEEMLKKTIEICIKNGKLIESDIPGIYYLPSIESYGFSKGHRYRLQAATPDLSDEPADPSTDTSTGENNSHTGDENSHIGDKKFPKNENPLKKDENSPKGDENSNIGDKKSSTGENFSPAIIYSPVLSSPVLSSPVLSSPLIINSRSVLKRKEENIIKEEKKKKSLDNREPPYEAIIADLNAKAGTRFRHDRESTRRLINARWREGFNLDDFKRVHDLKINQWLLTDMRRYIRPETLYAPSHFESYLNEAQHQQNSREAAIESWIASPNGENNEERE